MKILNNLVLLLSSLLLFAFVIVINNSLIAKTFKDTTVAIGMEMGKDFHNKIDMKMETRGLQINDTAGIIREGTIDLEAIDVNKDGKVYQDQKHWNVISDKLRACPLCKLTLQEVTLEEAKDNLKKHDFKVK